MPQIDRILSYNWFNVDPFFFSGDFCTKKSPGFTGFDPFFRYGLLLIIVAAIKPNRSFSILILSLSRSILT
jgi:hypothetical protein